MSPERRIPPYLKACFSAFREVSAAKYDGIPFDLPAIERKVAHLREKRMLGYDDLRYFEAPEHWWFTKFWVFPPERDLMTLAEVTNEHD